MENGTWSWRFASRRGGRVHTGPQEVHQILGQFDGLAGGSSDPTDQQPRGGVKDDNNMDPAEFYIFALRIVMSSPTPGPVHCRTAIGRAYYAVLNRADATLAQWGQSCGKGPQKHGLAVRFLHAPNDPDLVTASNALDDLRSLRNRADYDMNDVWVETVYQAKLALEFAKDVMDYLEAVENDATRRTSAEGHIKSYQRNTHTP